jgi:chemotaxis protein MotB
MNRRERRRSHVNHERWLVSYADFITLLFAFFVVLYASSKADQKKQAQVSQAINSAFASLGVFPDAGSDISSLKNVSVISNKDTTSSKNLVMGEDIASPAQVKEDLARVQKELEKMLASEITDGTVGIQMGKDGLVVSLREAGFFSSGSAAPHAGTLPVLKELAQVLGETPYDLRIEGHTDNIPIHNQEFDSNWELSSSRATHIARVFLATKSIAPERLSASGYAEFHPVASNDTADGRAENRRVDLVVKPRTKTNLTMPDGDADKASWHKIGD